MTAHERPTHRPAPIPLGLVAERLEVVAREYETRAAWFRERAATWRARGTSEDVA